MTEILDPDPVSAIVAYVVSAQSEVGYFVRTSAADELEILNEPGTR